MENSVKDDYANERIIAYARVDASRSGRFLHFVLRESEAVLTATPDRVIELPFRVEKQAADGPLSEGAAPMSRWLQRTTTWLAIATCVSAVLAGCVERRYLVLTDSDTPGGIPPATIVYENGQPIGASPADRPFVYYGTYHFTIVRDGYQTLQVDQCIAAPWYEFPGLDFISENLIPWTIRDVREFRYQLMPMTTPQTNELLNRADALRARGKAITPPPSEAPPVVVPVPPPVPPPPVMPGVESK
jgi:hypothetical protein